MFGSQGAEPGQFERPNGIEIGPDGSVYVADTGNHRIQKFTAEGQFVAAWGQNSTVEMETGLPQGFNEPWDVAVAPDGSPPSAAGVYIADTWNRRVQVFDANGDYLRQWDIAGWDAGVPDEKPYLAVDTQGYVYVTDPGHYRVLVFDHLGNYVFSFGQYGFDEQSFALPMGIAVADDGSIYVVDSHSGRVLVFENTDFVGLPQPATVTDQE